MAHLITQSNHKNTFRTKHAGISSQLIVETWAYTIFGHPGDQILKGTEYQYLITWQFEPFAFEPFAFELTTKIHSGQSIHSISSKLIAKHCGVTLYGHPGGQIRQWMYGCGYFVLSNMEGCRIIPIFGVNFGQNLVFDPWGVHV